ncbi:hypothetical protein [Halobacillus aidingensis]|uniref:YhfM-like domain-containing protein n=1 Tax=Halobacillus aidingensis TaxID=240303 RepID=A0A1H0LL01_HALAD|nr:hypothetical protein [Halobacillus aidingensis]SDO68899.1 hypothetical protein SAMN05421677_10753 [Halobacillus aidingensis]
MKKLLLLFHLAFCSITLIACQSHMEESTLLDSVSDISISKSNGYGGLNENYSVSINQSKDISTFNGILKNAKRVNRKVDVNNEKPDYDILVRYENGETHGLHLVLGNEGEESIVMHIGHEKNGFNVSSEDTKVLKSIIDIQ